MATWINSEWPFIIYQSHQEVRVFAKKPAPQTMWEDLQERFGFELHWQPPVVLFGVVT
jgi:hypothetical protein